jgi:hypothetical protein
LNTLAAFEKLYFKFVLSINLLLCCCGNFFFQCICIKGIKKFLLQYATMATHITVRKDTQIYQGKYTNSFLNSLEWSCRDDTCDYSPTGPKQKLYASRRVCFCKNSFRPDIYAVISFWKQGLVPAGYGNKYIPVEVNEPLKLEQDKLLIC